MRQETGIERVEGGNESIHLGSTFTKGRILRVTLTGLADKFYVRGPRLQVQLFRLYRGSLDVQLKIFFQCTPSLRSFGRRIRRRLDIFGSTCPEIRTVPVGNDTRRVSSVQTSDVSFEDRREGCLRTSPVVPSLKLNKYPILVL